MAAPREDARELLARLNPRELRRHHQAGLLGLVLLGMAPALVREITVLRLAGALFFAVFVMSWDVVSGYTGEISFGHAIFFGVGGYASGILNMQFGLPLPVTVLAGTLAAAVAGIVIGVPSLRLTGPYFSLITLVAPLILISVFRFFPGVTGGELGLVSASAPHALERISFEPVVNFYVAFAVFLFALVIFLAVTRSDAGIVFTAIRADEVAVASVGLNPAKFKVFAFVLSGTVGGFAGAVFIHTAVGSATPSEVLALVVSIEVIVAAILGGMGTITGAAVGGLFFYMVRQSLRNLSALVLPPEPIAALLGVTPATVPVVIPVVDKPLSDFYFLVFGVITLVFLFVLPEGIVPRLVRAWQGFAARTRSARADGASDRPGRRRTLARPEAAPLPLVAAGARLAAAIRALRRGERR